MIRRALALASVVIAVALVSVFSIDLGPSLRGRAERAAANYLKRDFRIGRLSARLLRGHFIVDDLYIGGLSPTDRPFFTAKQVIVKVPWWTIFRRELIVESVDINDWQMLVEQWEDGRHSFPKFTRDGPASTQPRRFVTTVRVVRASRGQFAYDDHGSDWGVVAPNLNLVISRGLDYRGEASFNKGVVRIGKFEQMWASMQTRFKIDGGKVLLDRIDLQSDGAVSAVTGTVDLAHWPEQTYYVQSRVQFPRMRELFFAHDKFSLQGEGHFVGTFHLFKGGRELKGRFTSEEARLNDWRFPGLDGQLLWLRDRFEVTNASSGLYGGRMALDFSMKPLGDRDRPGIARLDVGYQDVDLTTLTDAVETQGIRLAGRATGRNLLEWPLGKFRERHGKGEITATPPAGVEIQGREGPSPQPSPRERGEGAESSAARPLPPSPRSRGEGRGEGPSPTDARAERAAAVAARAARKARDEAFDRVPLRAPLGVGGHLVYAYDPTWIDVAPGWVATRDTYVEIQGRTAFGWDRAEFPFHVTSGDWQESDRVLAGILTTFGSSTRAIPIYGSGTFDGVMRGAFRSPRIEGRFAGDRIRAWDVEWGHTVAQIVIENAYVDVKDGVITRAEPATPGGTPSRVDVDGRFSIGYPRRDEGEEINARIRMTGRPLVDLKHAFDLDEYRVHGVLSGEFHLTGKYQRPFGFGRMTIDRGVAYGESFETATSSLRFEGNGVRLDAIKAAKGSGGGLTGAAFVDWDGRYSFNADGTRVPLESVDALAYPDLPLFGSLSFTASGSGTFEDPRYDVRGSIDDFFVQDEGIGQVNGRLSVRGDVLTIHQLEAASPRLAASGTGRITLTPDADAELTLRLTDTSLDPYVRLFEKRFSPFTTAIASGTVRITGALRDFAKLRLEATVEDIALRLFDYRLRNDGPIRVALRDNVARLERLRLVGDGTTLELFGDVGLAQDRIRIQALGDANLSILQGFLRDIRSSGAAELQAEITGPMKAPVLVGSATLTNGRLRYFALPHSIEAVNGRVEFDATGVRLDGLSGRMGGGEVRFGGRVGLRNGAIDNYAMTAVGRDMRVRYPEGFRSLVDADLALRGAATNPILTGTVLVKDALWVRSIETEGTGIFGLAAVGAGAKPAAPAAASSSAFPMRFDVRIDAPSTLRIENSTARLVSSAELTLRGTLDRPLLFGRADINRGEVFFEGNRYTVTRGTIDFSNPTRIDPFFDVEAETRARVPGEVYRVTFRITGTRERFVWDLTSDPPLAPVDILALLFGDLRDPRDADVRALRSRDRTEQDLLAARAARLLASPISSEVNKVASKTFGVDSVQITPSLSDPSNQQSARISPTARLTIGKRISDRLFLTYTQPITSSKPEQLVLIEYTQSDRLAWIVSRNEDETYAVDVRVRHIF